MVYGKEAVIPMEYIFPTLWIIAATGMDDVESLEECIAQLIHLEEDRFVTCFHQHVEKDQQKVWHDRHIKNK